MTDITRTLPRTKRARERSSLWRNIVGAIRELLTMPEPAVWFPPSVIDEDIDNDGYKVLYIRASNSRDLDRFIGGTVAGRQVVCTKLGKHTWRISTE